MCPGFEVVPFLAWCAFVVAACLILSALWAKIAPKIQGKIPDLVIITAQVIFWLIIFLAFLYKIVAPILDCVGL